MLAFEVRITQNASINKKCLCAFSLILLAGGRAELLKLIKKVTKVVSIYMINFWIVHLNTKVHCNNEWKCMLMNSKKSHSFAQLGNFALPLLLFGGFVSFFSNSLWYFLYFLSHLLRKEKYEISRFGQRLQSTFSSF